MPTCRSSGFFLFPVEYILLHGRKVSGDGPEIGTDHLVRHFGIDLGRAYVLVSEYLGKGFYRATVAEVDRGRECVPTQMECHVLIDAAIFGDLLQVSIANPVAGHGEHKVAIGHSPIPSYQILCYFHEWNITCHPCLGTAGDNPLLAVEIHPLYLVIGKGLYVNVAKPGETPEKEEVAHKAGLPVSECGVGYAVQFLFREVAPIRLLHFKAVFAERVGTDNTAPPSPVGQAEQGHGVNPKGIGA